METLKQAWADGHFTSDGQFASAILNAEAIGGLKVLQQHLDHGYLISELTSND